jgi:hypothetical protein
MAFAARYCRLIICALLLATSISAAPVAAAPVMARFPFRQSPVFVNPPMMAAPRINPNINPNFQITPGLSVSQAAFNIRVLGRALRSVPPYALGYNPYASPMMSSYGQGMYPMYAPHYPRMYSSSYPDISTSNYGAGAAGSNSAGSQTAASYTAPSAGDTKGGEFQGFMNANGNLDWPLALRILPPSLETTPLRERIDSLIQQVQTAAGKGKVDSALLKEADNELTQLRERLADKTDFLPVSQQAMTDARQFMHRLQGALKTLE